MNINAGTTVENYYPGFPHDEAFGGDRDSRASSPKRLDVIEERGHHTWNRRGH